MEQESDRAYAEFWRQLNSPPSATGDAHVRLDLLDAMSEDHRDQAALHLVARLRRAPNADRRMVQALGHLRAASAVPLLEPLALERSSTGVEALLALWRIDGQPERVRALADVVRETVAARLRRLVIGSDPVRVSAAIALGYIDVPESRAALVEAARDLDPAVRFNARLSLRRLRGEDPTQAAAEVKRGT